MTKPKESLVALDDGTVFNVAGAEIFNEATWWDGSNYISHATGSQWDHECLYVSQATYELPGGGHPACVVERESSRQGNGTTYRVVTPEQAAHWLVKNEHQIPDRIRELLPDGFIK